MFRHCFISRTHIKGARLSAREKDAQSETKNLRRACEPPTNVIGQMMNDLKHSVAIFLWRNCLHCVHNISRHHLPVEYKAKSMNLFAKFACNRHRRLKADLMVTQTTSLALRATTRINQPFGGAVWRDLCTITFYAFHRAFRYDGSKIQQEATLKIW